MHKLLARQLRRQFGSEANIPAELESFIDAVDRAYCQFDDDRALLERSMETVSYEMIDRYRRLQEALGDSERAKDEMNQALALVEATLESTTDGLLVVDQNGRMIRMNRKFVELWRIPDEIVESRDNSRALAYVVSQLEEPEEFLRRIAELFANPEAESYDTLRFKDHRVYERYSKPQRVGGVTVGRVWSFRDVTARLRLEDQLRQSQKMEAIGSLAGGVAHDFNNLLTVITGHVQFLQEEPQLSAEQNDDLDQVMKAATRAATLTRQLLAFGRRQILQPVLLDLNHVVLDVEPMLRRLIAEDIQIETVLDPTPCSVVADRGQLDQVLLNLAVNARDAMPKGGRLTITTSHVVTDEPSPDNASQLPRGSYVLLSVRDTGIGIREELRARVFEPFFTTKEPGKGTGLGLAMVYGIVSQSGGHIDVDSTEGVGTVFTIHLPVAGERVEAEPLYAEPVNDFTGTESILIAEDESAVRKLIARALTARGYTVLAAPSGREALAMAAERRLPIDLLVTDVVMPEMGGPELVDRLRQACPGTPVIFMSGYTDDEIIRRGPPQSGTVLLPKPFTASQLARTVREVLQSAQGERHRRLRLLA